MFEIGTRIFTLKKLPHQVQRNTNITRHQGTIPLDIYDFTGDISNFNTENLRNHPYHFRVYKSK